MKNLVFRLPLYLLILCYASSLPAIDVPLKYAKITTADNSTYSAGFRIMRGGSQAQYSEWKFPILVDDSPLCGLAAFGDSKLLMVFDRKSAQAPYYTVLYLDKNNNRDLTDDDVIYGTLVDDMNARTITIEFPAIEIEIDLDGEIYPYCFKPSVISTGTARSQPVVVFRPHCYYSGEFEYQGKGYHIALGDQTYNACFTDSYKVQPTRQVRGGGIIATGDKFYISESTSFDYFDSLGLGRWLIIGDELFEVNVDMSASRLSLTPASADLASLRLSARPERLSLIQKDTEDFFMLYQPKEKVFLNPGSYCIYSYEVFKKDPSGDLWRLNANGSSASPFIEANGEGALLRLGEPYTPRIEMQYDNRRKRSVLTFLTEGLGGELVQELKRIKGDSTKIELSFKSDYSQRPKEPTYTITKADGESVTSGSFEYG